MTRISNTKLLVVIQSLVSPSPTLTSSQVQTISSRHSVAGRKNGNHDSGSGGDASTVAADIGPIVQTIHEDGVAPDNCRYMTIADLWEQVEQKWQPETHIQLVRFRNDNCQALTNIQLVR